MRRVALALLGALLINTMAMAQVSTDYQQGLVTGNYNGGRETIAVLNTAIARNSRVLILNTRTAETAYATVTGYITASPNRIIANLSSDVWDKLGLSPDIEVKIFPPVPAPQARAASPAVTDPPPPPATPSAVADPAPAPAAPQNTAVPQNNPDPEILTRLAALEARARTLEDEISRAQAPREDDLMPEIRAAENRLRDLEEIAAKILTALEARDETRVAELMTQVGEIRRQLAALDAGQSGRLSTLEGLTVNKLSALDASEANRLTTLEGLAVDKLRTLDASEASRLATLEGLAVDKLKTLDANETARLTTLDASQAARLTSLETREAERLKALEAREAEILTMLETLAVNRLTSLEAREADRLKALEEQLKETMNVSTASSAPSTQIQEETLYWTYPVIIGLPDPSTNRVYNLQVGAFNTQESAARTAQLVASLGFQVVIEQSGTLFRVLAVNVPAGMVQYTAQRLAYTGIKEIWVREQ